MMREKNKFKWQKLLPEIQKKFDRQSQENFENQPAPIDPDDLSQLSRLKQDLSQQIIETLSKKLARAGETLKNRTDSVKQIILNTEILPFQLATRSNPVKEFGQPWRYDGGQVRFVIQTRHDKLELYSPKGEFKASFPVRSNGEVLVENLKPGVYLLYLRGRKIVEMAAEASEGNE